MTFCTSMQHPRNACLGVTGKRLRMNRKRAFLAAVRAESVWSLGCSTEAHDMEAGVSAFSREFRFALFGERTLPSMCQLRPPACGRRRPYCGVLAVTRQPRGILDMSM